MIIDERGRIQFMNKELKEVVSIDSKDHQANDAKGLYNKMFK